MNSFLKKFVIGEWNLGICNQDFLAEFRKVKKGGVLTLKVTWMRHNRPDSFFATPFIYTIEKDKAVILAEELIFSQSKGLVSRCTIDCIVVNGYREVFRSFFSIYIAIIVPLLRNLHLHK